MQQKRAKVDTRITSLCMEFKYLVQVKLASVYIAAAVHNTSVTSKHKQPQNHTYASSMNTRQIGFYLTLIPILLRIYLQDIGCFHSYDFTTLFTFTYTTITIKCQI